MTLPAPIVPVPVILASTSRYRRDLLTRLLADFATERPEVDETPLAGESPVRLAARLAAAKALAVAQHRPQTLVIGSDQVAEIDGEAAGKPGDRARAIEQLVAGSGRAVDFHTAVALADTREEPVRVATAIDRTRVVFRALTREEIERYVDREQPFDSAGSFKCEGLGIALFERIETKDPTALIGLPLIALAGLLREAGLDLP